MALSADPSSEDPVIQLVDHAHQPPPPDSALCCCSTERRLSAYKMNNSTYVDTQTYQYRNDCGQSVEVITGEHVPT